MKANSNISLNSQIRNAMIPSTRQELIPLQTTKARENNIYFLPR